MEGGNGKRERINGEEGRVERENVLPEIIFKVGLVLEEATLPRDAHGHAYVPHRQSNCLPTRRLY